MSVFKKLFGENNNDSENSGKQEKRTIELEITGMTCSRCATGIEKLFEEKKGILSKKVTYETGKAVFTYDSCCISKEEIVATINATKNYKVISETGSGKISGTHANDFDLIIIGGGSAAFSAATTASELGKKTLLINGGLPIGGTCVNVGCVPSKNLIRAAESIHNASVSPFSGIKPNTPEVDFGAIIRQKKELVKVMREKKYLNVANGIEGLTIIEGWATFKDEHAVTVRPIPNPSQREGGKPGYNTADPALYKLLKDFVKRNRQTPTEAEAILWTYLKGNKLDGFHFRRQHIIGRYIADFVCLKKKLVIEVDGLIHQLPENKESDQQRTEWLISQGYTVLRFTNEEVIGNIDNVLSKIKKKLQDLQFGKNLEFQVLPFGEDLGGVNYTASKFLIATGASTNIPPIEGLKEVGFLTNISLFDLEEKPESLTILGAGYIGLEIAMAYNRFGVKIRIIEFTDRVLRTQTPDISAELEKHMKNEGIEFHPNYRIEKVEKQGDNILIKGKNAKSGEPFEFIETGHIVVATGTKPNTDKLGLENLGLETDAKGFIKVDEQMRTSLPHIYAAGDCTNTPAFVYTAAKEAKIAVRNALAGENNKVDYTGLPWVVFTDPQVAGAGMDEKEAEAKGIPFETAVIPLSEVPRSVAALDTRGFIKLIRNPETDKLLGARIVAPEGGELAMQASLAIKYGITVTELAECFHPYLTLSEGIKLAAITFKKDVTQLSCCAS